MNDLAGLLWTCGALLGLLVLSWLMVRAIRWAKKGSKGASMLASAAFPFPEQPPPNEHVERINRLKKGTELGDPEH
jgi:hypothetical protein